jgi:hypothetical protein
MVKFYEASLGTADFQATDLNSMVTKLVNYYAMDAYAPQVDAIKIFEHDKTEMLAPAALAMFNRVLCNEWLDMVDNAAATEAVERGQMGVR